MYFAEEVVSKRTLTKNQSDALWILADGMGHSNRAISKQLKSKWSEIGNKRLNESNCLRDVIKPLISNKMIFSQKRKGEKTSTGIHDEEAYYIRQSALKRVYTVLKDVWNTKHERSLHWYDAYVKKELPPDLDNMVEEALNKLYLLDGLEKEIDEYEHSLQFIKDRAPNLNVLNPKESGYRNGYLPPNENYFILGKDISTKSFADISMKKSQNSPARTSFLH